MRKCTCLGRAVLTAISTDFFQVQPADLSCFLPSLHSLLQHFRKPGALDSGDRRPSQNSSLPCRQTSDHFSPSFIFRRVNTSLLSPLDKGTQRLQAILLRSHSAGAPFLLFVLPCREGPTPVSLPSSVCFCSSMGTPGP